jgi:hypothetical protein
MSEALDQFATAKYLNLETFRKSGVGVRTPVWFAQQGEIFYIYSAPDAGKVKRIRNNPKVRIAPCDFRGNLRGAWVDGHARFCNGDEAALGQALLRKKYGWLKIIGDFFSRLLGRTQTIIAVHLD